MTFGRPMTTILACTPKMMEASRNITSRLYNPHSTGYHTAHHLRPAYIGLDCQRYMLVGTSIPVLIDDADGAVRTYDRDLARANRF